MSQHDTAQKWLRAWPDEIPDAVAIMSPLFMGEGEMPLDVTLGALRRWAALEAQAPAVAELVRAARAMSTGLHASDCGDTPDRQGPLPPSGYCGCRMRRLRRALEPFEEVADA